MLKEIYEQPQAIADTIGERARGERLDLEEIGLSEVEIQNLRRMVILGCGTAYHSGVVRRYVIEEWARIPCEPGIASEWIYRNPSSRRTRSWSASPSRARAATRCRPSASPARAVRRRSRSRT